MLDIRLEIGEVNYQACVATLLPRLVEHCREKAAPNEVDRFFAELGAEAVPAAKELIGELDTDARDRLMVMLIAAHEERMRASANRHLNELFKAPVIRIGRFLAEDRPGARLALLATQVDIDYPRLLQSPVVTEGVEQISEDNGILKNAAKLAIQMGLRLSPENLERQGILLLNTAKVKSRLMAVLQDTLRQEGVDVALEGMVVERSAAAPQPSDTAEAGNTPLVFDREIRAALLAKANALRGKA